MPKRFVSWAAVSSLPQAKKISLEDQLRTNRLHVEKWGGTLVKELLVPGKSRSIVLFEDACAQIEAYAHLRDLIEQRAFDVLVFLDRSRLGRTASLTMTISELCERAGILCYATESPPVDLDDTSPNIAQKLTSAVQDVMTREEIVKLMRRHAMGMQARVMRGDFPGGVPWGWKTTYEVGDDGKPVANIVIDETAAHTIRTMVDLFLRRGLGFYTITTYLKDHGFVPPKGGEWTKGIVLSLFSSIWRYAGILELNRRKDSKRPYIRAKSKWPAIISEEDAQSVIDERQHRGRHRRTTSALHRFSLCVWCGQCGKRMSAYNGFTISRHNRDIRYPSEKYKCRNYDGYVTHGQSTISAKFVTEAAREAIEFVKDKKNRDKLAGQSTNRVEGISADIAQVEQRIAKNTDALRRADDQFVDGTMDMERYKRQIGRLREQWDKLQEELTRQKEALERELFDTQRAHRLLEVAEVGVSMLESDDILAANAWFLRHIKIEIQAAPKDRIKVYYL